MKNALIDSALAYTSLIICAICLTRSDNVEQPQKSCKLHVVPPSNTIVAGALYTHVSHGHVADLITGSGDTLPCVINDHQ